MKALVAVLFAITVWHCSLLRAEDPPDFAALETLVSARAAVPPEPAWALLETMPAPAAHIRTAREIFQCLDTCHSRQGDCTCDDCKCENCPCGSHREKPKATEKEFARTETEKPKVEPAAEIKPRSFQCLVLVSSWCVSCGPKVKEIITELPKKNWICDDTPAAHYRILDVDKYPDIARKYEVTQLPTIIFVRDGVEVRRLTKYPGYVELAKLFNSLSQSQAAAVDKSLATVSEVNYPVRSGPYVGYTNRNFAWTWEGLFSHLSSGMHAGKFDIDWLRTQNLAQLNSIHTDDHYNQLKWEYVVRPGRPEGMAVKAPAQRIYQPNTPRQYTRACPNGRCSYYVVN